jgi:hypothetical protein
MQNPNFVFIKKKNDLQKNLSSKFLKRVFDKKV